MKLYMYQNLNGLNEFENAAITPCIEYILSAININDILEHYHMPLEYDFYFESIDDVYKYFEFITAVVEGIDMREFIDADILIFRIIKFCIRHDIDYSEIINIYDIDGIDFVENQFGELINSEFIKGNEFEDFPFEFGSANNLTTIGNIMQLFASENANLTFLYCKSNALFINRLEYILRYQYKLLNDLLIKNKLDGSILIEDFFNVTKYSFEISYEKIYGMEANYKLSTTLNKPLINQEV